MDSLVTYVYRESPETRHNLEYFLKNALTGNATFHFVINGYECSLHICPKPNVKVFRRANSLDYEAFKFSIDRAGRSYDYYFFVNSSSIGPFLPVWNHDPWTGVFIRTMRKRGLDMLAPVIEVPSDSYGYLSMGERTPTVSPNVPFVHTYMFACTGRALQYLLRYQCFSYANKVELIFINERRVSACLLFNRLKVGSLLTKYRHVDFSDRANWNWKTWSRSPVTCPEVPLNYGNSDLNPYEVIFVKSIRNVTETRPPEYAGISDNLRNLLTNYVKWNDTGTDATRCT